MQVNIQLGGSDEKEADFVQKSIPTAIIRSHIYASNLHAYRISSGCFSLLDIPLSATHCIWVVY